MSDAAPETPLFHLFGEIMHTEPPPVRSLAERMDRLSSRVVRK